MKHEINRSAAFNLLKGRWGRLRRLQSLHAPRVIVRNEKGLVLRALLGVLSPLAYRLLEARIYDKSTCPKRDGLTRCLLDRSHDGPCNFKPEDWKVGKCELCGDESPRVECERCGKLACPDCYGFAKREDVDYDDYEEVCVRCNPLAD